MKNTLRQCALAAATLGLSLSAFNATATTQLEDPHLSLQYEGFQVIIDCRERAPIFFHYEPQLDTANYARSEAFVLDPNVPVECQQASTEPYRVPYQVYIQSGKKVSYHRGHLVTANHLDFSPTAIAMSNYMTNIVPMTATVNYDGAWRETEIFTECLRDRITPQDEKTFDVMGGVVWGNNTDNDYFINTHGVRTPDYLWKVMYDSRGRFAKEPSVIAWLIPNDSLAIKENLPRYRTTVRELEALIGYALPIPSELKDLDDMPLWEIPERCNRS